MNPAVGVTKILNNLEECLKILEDIKYNNEIALPLKNVVDDFTKLKRNMLDILSDGRLDQIERAVSLATEAVEIGRTSEHIQLSLENFLAEQKNLISSLELSLESSRSRIKNLRNIERISWFKSWDKVERLFDNYKAIVTSNSNWEYPVMEIFPGTGEMLPHALAAEPLYIVDWDQSLLDEVSSQFNDYYANKRLMKYTIEEFDLSPLPQNSFGFIYAINYLNFENLDGLEKLAKSVYSCLMPGGIYLFVYNNSNDWWSVENSVNYYFGLVDKEDLNNTLTLIGFEIVQQVHSPSLNSSYAICKKPGEIEYIKNSSILAKIIDKPEDLK